MRLTLLFILLLPIIALSEETEATIVEVKKDVSICRLSGNCNSATRGSRLIVGDTIETKEGSSSRLEFSTGTVIDIGENSRMVIAAISPKEKKVQTNWGKFDFDVKKADSKSRFKVESPVAVAGTEGTTFTVEVEKSSGETTILLRKGLLRITGKGSSQDSFLLKPNHAVRLQRGTMNFKPFRVMQSRPTQTESGSHQLKKGATKTTAHITGKTTKSQSVDIDNAEETKTEVIIEID